MAHSAGCMPADEVYSVDWSPSSGLVASGGKDRVLRLWAS